MPDKGVRLLSSLDELELPAIRELYDLWQEKKGARKMPQLGDFDLIETPELAPYIIIIDVIDGGKDFRVRFSGTVTTQIYERELTGLTFSSFHPSPKSTELAQETWEVLTLAIEARAPSLNGPRQFNSEGREFLTIQAIHLPLAATGDDSDDPEIAHLLCALAAAEK